MSVFPYAYDQFDLPNSLRVITVPAPYRQIASLYIVVSAGSRNEIEPGRSGFAHFFEHMMFRGTPAFPSERYEAAIQSAGASSNAYTDDDRTVYHTTLAAEDLDSLMAMEADRFQNLSYPEQDFRTEALAVLGEYNKDSTEPVNKLLEVLRDRAFDVHTYKHTTMGFLRDIERMPEMYDYSLSFFDRFYRPEYTTLIVAGDVTSAQIRDMAQRHWGAWKRGSWTAQPDREPPPSAAREAHISWPTHTLPYILLGFRAPAYSDSLPASAALDLAAYLGFGEDSPLYADLVLDNQWVDILWASNADHIDPYLFTVLVRGKDPSRLNDVRARVLETINEFSAVEVDPVRLAGAQRRLRYQYALTMNSCEGIASSLAHAVSLTRGIETINRRQALIESLAPADLIAAARAHLTESAMTVVTLSEVVR
ncbi:MAG: insulinase family protein [Bryobacteraceae bacterium]|nr:insulinase family protein [Bryobacteraceae bacterium]